MNTLKIEVQGKEATVTGAGFCEMLEAVKAVEGRRWDGDRKLWVLPCTAEKAKELLAPLQLLGSEDEVLDAEITEIQKIQKWILEDEEAIQAKVKSLDESVREYSFGSKSKVKKSLAIDCACLRHALASAKLPIEKLAEIQIRGMKSACQIMGWL